ncbi:D-alanyl-D-alanine carboxypeptidase family protein [Psychrobacillus glaciei]|uniref:D-alanyl-D-alanine carboxypeptidase family protein n=1 Tax=Psychrobacillus glaciei TaxID=2283160 RepID=A0A5J6SW08_9BACI|nr:M15 family metallopeptidase [Psychrobacillus glaciei]QFG00528.1 D-alanyl-D-alanine carboxypeptidase family protein [Psychrobacillus glaciei]
MKSRQSLLKQKKQKKWPYIVGGSIAVLLIGAIVVWIGINDWNIDKGMTALGLSNQVEEPELEQKGENSTVDELAGEKTVEETPKVEKPVVEEPEIDMSGPKGYEGHETLPTEPKYVDGVLIASKKYPLPSTFAPGESKEGREAFEEMAAEAKLSGYELVAFSTYRSFEYQTTLYERYVSHDGQEAADRYSARPGFSEHQSGLAFDIGEKHFEQHFARESFGETEAGKWIAENAFKYGFIMRYPKDKEKITGYMYEPWHFRYVGKQLAKEVFDAGTTLEEYLGI